MSSASATRTVKFISKSGTYTTVILSPQGDVWQEYEGPSTAPTRVYPDFATVQPTLYLQVLSSRVAEVANIDCQAVKYYFNDVEIVFDDNDTSVSMGGNGFGGYFKRLNVQVANRAFPGLQFLKNVVPLATAPATVRMEAPVSYGTQTDTVQASYTIGIRPSTGTSYKVVIEPGDSNNFTIWQKNGSCILKAMVYLSGNPVTSGISYKWERMDAAQGWVNMNKATQTITVADADVATFGMYRLTVMQGSNVLGTDIQGVMDSSDPYDIAPHPEPEDETINEDNATATVTYTPVIITRGTGAPAPEMAGTKFYFSVTDAAGNELVEQTNVGVKLASYTVTLAMCQQVGGDLLVTITAAD